jgi:hypothetical protein
MLPYAMAFISTMGKNGRAIWLERPEEFFCGTLPEAPVDVIVVEIKVEGYEG